jgi:ankyrin repeat protein
MEYKNFENTFFEQLKQKNVKKCLNLITTNEIIVNQYLGETGDESYKESFVKRLNDKIIKEKYSLNLVKKILKHDLFKFVFKKFKNSDILINACKQKNKKLINWLFNLNFNPCVVDENGMTALMHAAENPDLLFVVQYYVEIYPDKKCLHIADKNNETVLFHALNNINTLRIFFNLPEHKKVDINHTNKNHETILIYCCKKELYKAAKVIVCQKDVDFNITDNNGYSAHMYLIEKGCHEVLEVIPQSPDINEENAQNIMKKLIQMIEKARYSIHPTYIQPYIYILKCFADNKYNFNVVIDDEGNSPIMYFLMIEDFCTVYYLMKNCELDLSFNNDKNDDVYSLCMKLNNKYLKKFFLTSDKYPFNYLDKYNNNLLMYFCIRNDIDTIKYIISKKKDIIHQVNDKNENALIISSKLGHFEIVRLLLINNCDPDCQDYLGNTALYYAVDIGNDEIVNVLMFNHANPNIKNKKGISPIDLAEKIQDNYILEVIKNPISPLKYKKRDKKGKRSFFKKKGSKLLKSKSSSVISNDTKSVDIDMHQLQINKYKNIVDFYVSESKENKYKPLPQGDIIRNIEFSIYEYKANKNSLVKVVGLSKDRLYEGIIIQSLGIYAGFKLIIF